MLECPESQSDWTFIRPPNLGEDIVVLARRTSLSEAVEIARSGVYWPRSCDPTFNDSGMNAFVANRPGRLDQCFDSAQVWLVLYWRGPVEVTSAFPLPRNVLCVHLPWRVVVPVGTDEHLSIAGVCASDESWADHHIAYPWFCRGSMLKSWYRWKVIYADRAMLARAIEEELPIRIGVAL